MDRFGYVRIGLDRFGHTWIGLGYVWICLDRFGQVSGLVWDRFVIGFGRV